MRSIEEKATRKGKLYSAESSNWEEGRLGGRSPIHWNAVSATTRKKPKQDGVTEWQRPREETVPVIARKEGARGKGEINSGGTCAQSKREEGARVQRGAVLNFFATTETNEQLKDDTMKRKQSGIGTPEPVEIEEMCQERVSTTDMQNLRTGTRTTDGRGRC